jgi:hypothetical protein
MDDVSRTIEIWSTVIGDLLHRVPPECRSAVLAKANGCEAQTPSNTDAGGRAMAFGSLVAFFGRVCASRPIHICFCKKL